ncbi:MAG TPA: phosphatidate cytidylyltransferase, partial [Vicinamibacterales bacterium]
VRARRRVGRGLALIAPVVFAALAAGAIALAISAPPRFVAYVYLIVAGFDGFCQAGGQLAGKRRLAPRVSPGKTVEGFFIGIAGAIVCALLLQPGVVLSVPSALRLGCIIALAGAAGDLAASWMKRRAGLKDFGAVLPGHGGVLDRFDSFFAAATLLFLLGY